ncbi:MAG: hypothetical protein PHH19_03500 [Eubacteriales bacterium]|nr:hypothetical protein [Eubacteriales bacterium]NCC81698.1 hypothetical protein [Clostridia bacterium]
MPKPLYIDRKGLRHHGDIQEEYLNNLKRGDLELGQVLNYAEETGTNEYNFVVTGITDDVIYLEAVPLSVSVDKDEQKLQDCNIVKNYLDEYNKK